MIFSVLFARRPRDAAREFLVLTLRLACTLGLGVVAFPEHFDGLKVNHGEKQPCFVVGIKSAEKAQHEYSLNARGTMRSTNCAYDDGGEDTVFTLLIAYSLSI